MIEQKKEYPYIWFMDESELVTSGPANVSLGCVAASSRHSSSWRERLAAGIPRDTVRRDWILRCAGQCRSRGEWGGSRFLRLEPDEPLITPAWEVIEDIFSL